MQKLQQATVYSTWRFTAVTKLTQRNRMYTVTAVHQSNAAAHAASAGQDFAVLLLANGFADGAC